MIAARDTFLHFLSDNLPPEIPVHPLRQGMHSTEVMAVNAVNVRFMDINPGVSVSVQQVSVDVIHEDENIAVDWMTEVWNLLSAAFYTPLLDYTDPSNPTPAGSNIMWDRDKVVFRRISMIRYATTDISRMMQGEQYCHYSCLLPLKFHTA